MIVCDNCKEFKVGNHGLFCNKYKQSFYSGFEADAFAKGNKC